MGGPNKVLLMALPGTPALLSPCSSPILPSPPSPLLLHQGVTPYLILALQHTLGHVLVSHRESKGADGARSCGEGGGGNPTAICGTRALIRTDLLPFHQSQRNGEAGTLQSRDVRCAAT